MLWTCTLLLLPTVAWRWALLTGLVAVVLSIAAVCSTLLRRRFMTVAIVGSSMVPTYRNGDRVLVRRHTAVRTGEVVVLESAEPGSAERHRTWIIKRVIATPGEPTPRDRIPVLACAAEDHVPSDKLVLLGDNPASSIDSRQLGYYARENVAGTVLRVLQRSRRSLRSSN
jgi:signal peptidase I